MKKVVVIGANEFQNPLILRAKELGYETHVFAWAAGDVGEQTADVFYPISIVEKESILEACRRIQPDAVTSIGSDLAMITVNYIAEQLGLPCNGTEVTRRATNKYEMRWTFQRAGLKCPRFWRMRAGEEPPGELRYPVIVKPTDRSGSRGITKVDSPKKLPAALREAAAYSFEHQAIVEEFITGPEYSCEGISHDGRHTLLAFTQKYTTGAPRFIETGHVQPAGLSPLIRQLAQDSVERALTALGVREGASHSEFRITPEGEVVFMEIGARMGGDCIGSHLVPYSTGRDYVKMVIDTALGLAPDLTVRGKPRPTAIRFLLSQKDLVWRRALAEQCFVREDSPLLSFGHPVVDSATRCGYTIFSAGNLERLCAYMPEPEPAARHTAARWV